MADGNLSGLVVDPQFQQLSPAEQRQALSGVTGDPTFNSLSDDDIGGFISKMNGSNSPAVPSVIANAANPAGGAGGSWTPDPPKDPSYLDVANAAYSSNPNDPTLKKIGKSFGRTALMVPNLLSAATTGPYAQETADGYAPDDNLALKIYDRGITLPIKHVISDPSVNAYEHLNQVAAKQAASYAAKGKPLPTSAKIAKYAGEGLAAIPFVGPFALQEGEQAARGDVAGTLTDIGTMALMPEGIKAASEYGEVAAPLRGPLKSAGIGLTPTEKLVKAGGPSVNDLKFPQTLNTAADRLADQNAIKPIESVQDLADGAHEAAQKLWTNEIDPQIARHAGEVIDGRAVAQQIVNNISDGTADLFPHEADDAVNFAATLEKDITLPKANEYLKTLNAKLESFYKMSPEARQSSRVTDGQISAYESAADGLRDQIYSKLNALGENDPQGLRQQYGALKNIQRVFGKRALVTGRQAPLNIPQVLGTAAGLSEAAGTLLNGHPVAAIPGVTMAAIPTVLKYLNAPDQLVRSAMKNLRPGSSTSFRGALWTPAIGAAAAQRNKTTGQQAADHVAQKFPNFFQGKTR